MIWCSKNTLKKTWMLFNTVTLRLSKNYQVGEIYRMIIKSRNKFSKVVQPMKIEEQNCNRIYFIKNNEFNRNDTPSTSLNQV